MRKIQKSGEPTLDTRYILLAASLWVLLGPVSRLVLREGVGPLEIAFWHRVIAWVLFAVHPAVYAGRASFVATP